MDHESEIMELQRRIGTLTAALSDKAEENLEFAREVQELRVQGPRGLEASDKRLRASEEELERLRHERQAQEELNQEFQRRITTLSVCLTELAEINAAALVDHGLTAKEVASMQLQNDTVEMMGRQAALGLAPHLSDQQRREGLQEPSTPERQRHQNAAEKDASSSNNSVMHTPVTPQLLQDYQSEIERLKFRLRKRKGKMEKLKEEVLHQKDLADSAKKSCTKYERELKRMQRDMSEALEKEVGRRKKTEQMAKSLQRRIGELEFLLENEASIDEAGPDDDLSNEMT